MPLVQIPHNEEAEWTALRNRILLVGPPNSGKTGWGLTPGERRPCSMHATCPICARSRRPGPEPDFHPRRRPIKMPPADLPMTAPWT